MAIGIADALDGYDISDLNPFIYLTSKSLPFTNKNLEMVKSSGLFGVKSIWSTREICHGAHCVVCDQALNGTERDGCFEVANGTTRNDSQLGSSMRLYAEAGSTLTTSKFKVSLLI